MVTLKQSLSETIGQCADKRYKKKNARVQRKLAKLRFASDLSKLDEKEKTEKNYEPIPEPDALGTKWRDAR